MGVQRTAWFSVEWTEAVTPEEALILSLGRRGRRRRGGEGGGRVSGRSLGENGRCLGGKGRNTLVESRSLTITRAERGAVRGDG